MKFADKLFLSVTALLMLIFTVFGIWMLSSGFSVLFDKETEQGSSESQTFCFLFEMGYQSAEEYGEEYAVNRTLDSITDSVERDGSHLFVLREDGTFFAGEEYVKRMSLADETDRLVQRLRETNEESGENYGYCIRRLGESYYMLTAIVTFAAGEPLYLGICRELTPIYESRRELMNRYRAALLILLVLGGVCIYVLSRYMTRPIRDLDRVARGIAGGNSSLRSGNQSPDEVGELARSFNRMADELVEQARQKALEAKQKEDFTAAFAHELKTPLTSIIGYADMMNSVKMTEEEQAEAVLYIYSQGKRLESLSHKLLELVSMDKAPLEAKPVPARRLEEKMRVTMRPIWEQKGIHGKVELDRGTIYGDEDLLLSLFYNLLDNAVKAMDKGDRGFILMKGYGLPEGGYEVKVVDNGRGIPEEEISRITEAFYMVDKSRSRREGGAGIGMALCRRIINLHGGRLQIDSKLGEGTVVKVTFPGNHEAEDAPAAPAQRIRAEAIRTEEKRRGNTAE